MISAYMNIQNNFTLDDIPFVDVDFNNLSTLRYISYTKQQSRIIQDVIANIYNTDRGNGKYICHIYGQYGTGKSFILRELERFLKQRKARVLYYTAEQWTKDKKKYSNIQKGIYDFIIIDDIDKIKKTDISQFEEIVKMNNTKFIISSDKRNIDYINSKNLDRHKISSLSVFETYSYINNNVYINRAISTIDNKQIFSFLSKFIIYLLSVGLLRNINKIAFYCLDKATQEKKDSISIRIFINYLQNNISFLRNTLVLFIKYFFLVFVIITVFILSKEIYLKANKARFDRIKQEIELQNLKNSL